ncbi:MAG: MotA/TolQ/ExbB proton channel family protein [Myxococcota bacterium]
MKRLALVLLLGLLGAAAPVAAQDFGAAEKEVDARLQKALSELAATREKIAREKIPLSKSVSGLESQVLKLRRKRGELQKVRDSRSIDLGSLRRQVESLAAQEDFVNSRLNEFVRDFEGRLNISELPVYEELTATAKLAEQNVNLQAEEKRTAQIAVVEAALGRLAEQLGGRVFDGQALSPEGVLTDGRFIAIGPTVFYASNDGDVVGLVESQLNAADPVVAALPGGYAGGIREIAASGSGTLPLDATLGKALRVEKARKSVFDYVEDGGVVGHVIIALGLAALLLTAFKTIEIVGFEVADPKQVDGVLDAVGRGDASGAEAKAKSVPGVSGDMLLTGVAFAHEKRSVLEELLFEKILRVRPTLERHLPFLAITAAAAPLLGLLGTVVGMIRTFQLITVFGTGDAKSLSSGISEALITTALGLIVAIPTLILHGALSRMAKRKLGLLEELSVAFVNGVSAIRADDRKPLARTPEDLRG